MAADSEAWQDFGQKVDLTARIREILLNYPEGTSILKELVQVGAPLLRCQGPRRNPCCLPGPMSDPTAYIAMTRSMSLQRLGTG